MRDIWDLTGSDLRDELVEAEDRGDWSREEAIRDEMAYRSRIEPDDPDELTSGHGRPEYWDR